MAEEDKTLVCCDCGCEFIFAKEEQEFFETKNFYEPRRCPNCRKARRESRNKAVRR